MVNSFAPLRKQLSDEIHRFWDAPEDTKELTISLRKRRLGMTHSIAEIALELARRTTFYEKINFDKTEVCERPLQVLIWCNDDRAVENMQHLLSVYNKRAHAIEMTEFYKNGVWEAGDCVRQLNVVVKSTNTIKPEMFLGPFDASLRGQFSSADIMLVDDAQFLSALNKHVLPDFCKKIVLCKTGQKEQTDDLVITTAIKRTLSIPKIEAVE